MGGQDHLLKTSAAIGTVELTGLEMMATSALGEYFAIPAARSRTIPAETESTSPSRECSGKTERRGPLETSLNSLPASTITDGSQRQYQSEGCSRQ